MTMTFNDCQQGKNKFHAEIVAKAVVLRSRSLKKNHF